MVTFDDHNFWGVETLAQSRLRFVRRSSCGRLAHFEYALMSTIWMITFAHMKEEISVYSRAKDKAGTYGTVIE